MKIRQGLIASVMPAAARRILPACLCLLCVAFALGSADSSVSSDNVLSLTIEFFTDPDCNDCDVVRQEVLPFIEVRYGGLYRLVESDMNDDEAVLRMAEAADRLGIADNKRIFLLINGQYAFCDPAVMLNEVFAAMDSLVQNGVASLQ